MKQMRQLHFWLKRVKIIEACNSLADSHGEPKLSLGHFILQNNKELLLF